MRFCVITDICTMICVIFKVDVFVVQYRLKEIFPKKFSLDPSNQISSKTAE
jgi:hypothetical protein